MLSDNTVSRQETLAISLCFNIAFGVFLGTGYMYKFWAFPSKGSLQITHVFNEMISILIQTQEPIA